MTQISKVYVEWQYKNLKVDTKQNDAPPPFSIKDVSSLTILRSMHEHQAMCLGCLVQFESKDEVKGKKLVTKYSYFYRNLFVNIYMFMYSIYI